MVEVMLVTRRSRSHNVVVRMADSVQHSDHGKLET